MPRVGYLITPDCELYLTAGARVVKHKVNVTETVVATSKTSTKKDKSSSSSGHGIEYDFTPNLFAKAEYDYLFKSKFRGRQNIKLTHLNLGLDISSNYKTKIHGKTPCIFNLLKFHAYSIASAIGMYYFSCDTRSKITQ